MSVSSIEMLITAAASVEATIDFHANTVNGPVTSQSRLWTESSKSIAASRPPSSRSLWGGGDIIKGGRRPLPPKNKFWD